MSSSHKLIPDTFSTTPSLSPENPPTIDVVGSLGSGLDAVGHLVGADGEVPAELGFDREYLARAGFEGKVGETFVVPRADGPAVVAVGAGAGGELTASTLRDAVAAFSRATHRYDRLGFVAPGADSIDAEAAGQVIAEGLLLARYRYTAMKGSSKHVPLAALEIQAASDADALRAGVEKGRILARAGNVSRDLANTPPGHLTATDFADTAVALGQEFGLDVTVFDKAQLIELGCGGLLGVNAGSAEEPRMIQVRYAPAGSAAGGSARHIAMIGKGITYDSGGISLKPSDAMHLAMKMDMAGAGAVMAAMTALRDLGCPNKVSAFLMCTDNMPSGSATKLGDVLTIRGGKTVEVKNTDAEGRLVMSDGLALAAEESPDAIVDIATLTGAALMALGQATAAVFTNNEELLGKVRSSAEAADEPVWQLPLEHKYRKQIDSDVADIANLGGPFAGAAAAALFLEEFVDGIPWAHIDIAGTMLSDADESWRSKGATGFGARLLADLAMTF